jgi:hypothetical protein
VDSQQARQILELYRPGVDDADPRFAEALAFAKRDSELRRWFEEQCALYAAIHARFSEIPVPDGLRDRILAGRKVVPTVAWWRNPVALAAAAAIVVLAAIAGFLVPSRGPANFNGFRRSMARAVSGEYKMMLETNDLNQIREFLAKHQAQADYILTSALQETHAEGCSILNWHGHKVSLLCFEIVNDKDLWLFVVDRAALPDAPAAGPPQFASVGKLATAGWSEGEVTYLLAIAGDEKNLRKYL